jgi:hypothetical protein
MINLGQTVSLVHYIRDLTMKIGSLNLKRRSSDIFPPKDKLSKVK